MPTSLSIVIPAWNEGNRIGPTLDHIAAWLAQPGSPSATGEITLAEVVIVDDGSTDDTAAIVRTLRDSRLPSVRLLRNPRNRGKGFSVRRGLLAARADWLLMCDADLAAELAEFDLLAAALREGADIAIASRRAPGALLRRTQPWPRQLAAAIFHRVRRRTLLPDIADTQCGFKLLRRDVAHAVLPDCFENGWLLDCELLAVAQRRGYRIAEVGITWADAPDSRLRLGRWALGVWPGLRAIRHRVQSLPD